MPFAMPLCFFNGVIDLFCAPCGTLRGGACRRDAVRTPRRCRGGARSRRLGANLCDVAVPEILDALVYVGLHVRLADHHLQVEDLPLLAAQVAQDEVVEEETERSRAGLPVPRGPKLLGDALVAVGPPVNLATGMPGPQGSLWTARLWWGLWPQAQHCSNRGMMQENRRFW